MAEKSGGGSRGGGGRSSDAGAQAQASSLIERVYGMGNAQRKPKDASRYYNAAARMERIVSDASLSWNARIVMLQDEIRDLR